MQDAGRVARSVRVTGVVQGVGFRPYVFRLARTHGLTGWVLNGGAGVEIHVEGGADRVSAFLAELRPNAPPAAHVAAVIVEEADADISAGFEIRHSAAAREPTTRVSPDLAVCESCLVELIDPSNPRYQYPYINCTDCGPRYSIVRDLPYDRPNTTMAAWPLCPACAREYDDPGNRRFHAQPVACAACGPGYTLTGAAHEARGHAAIERAARLLREGAIVAVKGIGGYHLSCDADNASAVAALRGRKYRKEQAFAVMVRDEAVAARTVHLSTAAAALLTSAARPIVVVPAREELPGVAPDNRDIGVMLAYAPLHHLLFAAGAPERLVMTSGNRSSEPIAFEDPDARARLGGLADALLIGERPIARRVDDSVVRAGALGPVILRRSRGYAPDAVAMLPARTPILAVGGDLKSAVTLVVEGQAYVSQHIGDLSQLFARRAFEEAIADLLAMYRVRPGAVVVAHDCHPEYMSTQFAKEMPAARVCAVQHHRAHVASVLAEREALDRRVVGIAFDGTGYGDDGAIWGGEVFAGSVADGLRRVAHLRPALLAGGDAAAHVPVQAAAGFLCQIDASHDFTSPPFGCGDRYVEARALIASGVRVFPTTSAGRLFDTVAALLGFTRPMTFEGQAAMWLEYLARGAVHATGVFPLTFDGREIDWRPMLAALVDARVRGTPVDTIARVFHRSVGRMIASVARRIADDAGLATVVLSGGVMQNDLLLADVRDALAGTRLELWTNRAVPPNDGGISLGQAAFAACSIGV